MYKNVKQKLWAPILVIALFFGVIGLNPVKLFKAKAEEPLTFDYSAIEGKLSPDIDEADVKAAFDAELTRLLSLSEVDFDSPAINAEPGANNYPYSNAIMAHLQGVGNADLTGWGWGEGASVMGRAYIIYNPFTKEAYSVYDNFSSYFLALGGMEEAVGYPTGNIEYSQDGTKAYQNYQNAYYYGTVGETGITSIARSEYGKNVIGSTGNTLTEEDVTGIDPLWMVYVTSFSCWDPEFGFFARIDGFTAAANAISLARNKMLSGVYIGWQGLTYQDIDYGDGTAWSSPPGRAMIVYNPVVESAFAIHSRFIEYYSMNQGTAGYPAGNDFTADEFVYQNYSNGYAKHAVSAAGGSGASSVSFIANKKVNELGIETEMFTESEIGEFLSAADIPNPALAAGYTKAKVMQDIKTEAARLEALGADNAVGVPMTYILYDSVNKAFSQKFYNAETQKYTWMRLTAPDYLVLVSGSIAEQYAKPKGYFGETSHSPSGESLVGVPTHKVFTHTDGATYQNFSAGYISIKGSGLTAQVKIGIGKTIKYDSNNDLILDNGNLTFNVLDYSSGIFKGGNLDADMPSSWGKTGDYVTEKFVEKYNELIASGFAAGKSDSEGVRTWYENPGSTSAEDYREPNQNNDFPFGRGAVILSFNAGDSTAAPWWDSTMYMMYNPALDEVFTVQGAIMSYFAHFRARLGAPMGEMFQKGNFVYQNFELGYVRASATTAGAGNYYDDLYYDEELGFAIPNTDISNKIFVVNESMQFVGKAEGYEMGKEFKIENLSQYFITRAGTTVTYTSTKGTVTSGNLSITPDAVSDTYSFTITATADDNSTATMTVVIKVIPSANKPKGNNLIWLWATLGAIGGAALIGAGVWFFIIKKKKSTVK